jgi:hypothetical protein
MLDFRSEKGKRSVSQHETADGRGNHDTDLEAEHMINRSDERHCFRLLLTDRCYYISEFIISLSDRFIRSMYPTRYKIRNWLPKTNSIEQMLSLLLLIVSLPTQFIFNGGGNKIQVSPLLLRDTLLPSRAC